MNFTWNNQVIGAPPPSKKWSPGEVRAMAASFGFTADQFQVLHPTQLIQLVTEALSHVRTLSPEALATVDWNVLYWWASFFHLSVQTDPRELLNQLQHRISGIQVDDSIIDVKVDDDESPPLPPWEAYQISNSNSKPIMDFHINIAVNYLGELFDVLCPGKKGGDLSLGERVHFGLYRHDLLTKAKDLLTRYVTTFPVQLNHLQFAAVALFYVLVSQDALDDDSDCVYNPFVQWIDAADPGNGNETPEQTEERRARVRPVFTSYITNIVHWLFHL
jgi:hypothetical protein